jgi:hypothetical protein
LWGNHLLEPELDHLREVAPVVKVRDYKEKDNSDFETRDHPANHFFLAHVCIIPFVLEVARGF